MKRDFYLALAAAGARLPIGTHLILHQQADAEAALLDGRRLGEVLIETAARFRTPLAVPLMDLTLEKDALLRACGVPAAEIAAFHFDDVPRAPATIHLTERMRASCAALSHVAAQDGLLPIGMTIGPFSLATKLLADPITPVYLAGEGTTADDDAEVARLEQAMVLGEQVIHRYVTAQIETGARAMVVCEPAANSVYFSPLQFARNPAPFERYVIEPMRRVAALLSARGVDLIFHDCGELTDGMVRRFSTLGAVMISLGASRRLWEDAAFVPKDTVLYGNLPTKRFYDAQLTVAEVTSLAEELLRHMRNARHPFILGSECDVLSVPGKEREILAKVDAFMQAAAPTTLTAAQLR
ncbi:MAG: hypothetical protein C0518_01855 [Opitutus sp.]|nr:hypothetical protein [Opitutus sp.]